MGRENNLTLCFFLFIFIGLKLYYVHAASCTIPSGGQYGRSVYRPRFGSNTKRYSAGRRVRSGTKIAVTCKEDIYHDLVTDVSFSRCTNRRWIPALPQCKAKERCRAPPTLQYATASELITPHITFPHGTTVKYTCDVDKLATGNYTIVCDDGQWTAPNFRCIASENDCALPRGSQYRRSVYRPQSGPSTDDFRAGSTIIHGTKIVTICKKDIYGDLITKWTLSECRSGEWVPVLPNCKAKRRCRAPPEVQNATVSEMVTKGITFPHGTSVSYTCDVGKMATGNDAIICNDGQWSDTNLKCEEARSDKNRADGACSRLIISNGNMFAKDSSNGIYDVTCDAGYRLKSDREYVCRNGHWIGEEPECKQALARCKFPATARRRSLLKMKETGEVINNMYIDHWTQALQTCKRELRSGSRRTVRCVNGRWRPRLMTCRSTSRHNRRLRTYSNCTIPVARGGPAKYNNVTSGEKDAFKEGDEITHGQVVQRVCSDGFVLLPVLALNSSMIIWCDNGEWEPAIKRCLRNENDTTSETTTTVTSREQLSTSSSTSSRQTSTQKQVKTQIILPPKDIWIIKGSRATFHCGVSHDPSIEVTLKWSHRMLRRDVNTEIIPNSRRSIGPDGTLSINDVSATDIGDYTCLVTSAVGNDIRTASLTVIELPQAPAITSVSLHPHNRSAVLVKWISGYDGNTPIIKFSVQYKEVLRENVGNSNNHGWITSKTDIKPADREALVTGLQPGKRYQFSVFASNEVGDGPPCHPKPNPALEIPQPLIEYRVLIRLRDGNRLPTYIILNGTLNKGVKLLLVHPQKVDDLRLYTVTADNVGEIENIVTSSSNGSVDNTVKSVSVYNPDIGIDGFYITRYRKYNPRDPQEITGKPCKRQFGDDLDIQPNYPNYSGKDEAYSSVKDEVGCKLLCVEQYKFNCTMAYYNQHYDRCIVLEKSDRELYVNVAAEHKKDTFLFKRKENCFNHRHNVSK